MTQIRAESIWATTLADPLRVSILRRMLQASAAIPAELARWWQVDPGAMRRQFHRLRELGVIEPTGRPELYGRGAYVLRDKQATANALWRFDAPVPTHDAAERFAARASTIDGPHRTAVQRLRARREQLGLSQATLSRRVGLHSETVGIIERGHTDPRLSVVLVLADELALPPEQLFGSRGADPQADACR